jgi:hypothetical protein
MPIDANADSRDLNDYAFGASQSSAVAVAARASAAVLEPADVIRRSTRCRRG